MLCLSSSRVSVYRGECYWKRFDAGRIHWNKPELRLVCILEIDTSPRAICSWKQQGTEEGTMSYTMSKTISSRDDEESHVIDISVT